MLKDKLREARKKAGMTQKQVAEALGVTESTYCGYETGKRQPEVLKVKAIADILGVSGDYLLETGYEANEKKPTLISEDELDELDIQLLGLIKCISIKEKQLLIAQLQTAIAGRKENQ